MLAAAVAPLLVVGPVELVAVAVAVMVAALAQVLMEQQTRVVAAEGVLLPLVVWAAQAAQA
jgi:hypothetical protein